MVSTSLLDDHRKSFEDAVLQGDFDTILELVNDELDDGAEMICIPVDIPEDHLPSFLPILQQLQGFVTVPLAFYGNNPICLEKTLRVYQGKACVFLDEQADFDACAAVAGRYGAAMGFSDK